MSGPSVPVLRLGSSGPFVAELQNLLNAEPGLGFRLTVNSRFDGPTDAAVRRFQTARWLVVDGVVGRCTWSALKGWETDILYPQVNMVPQTTPDTCWAASTAMVLGRTSPVTDELGLYRPGGIPNDSQVDDPAVSTRYYRHWGLTLHHAQSWTVRGLAGLMRSRGPLLLSVLWNVDRYTRRDPNHPGRTLGSSGHYVVLSGLRGDGTEAGTTVRIHDPLPVGSGRIGVNNYARLMRLLPAATYQVCHR